MSPIAPSAPRVARRATGLSGAWAGARLAPLACAVTLACLPTLATAQIRTDASLGRPAATLTGPNFQIPESLGRLAGSNLFHSFQAFNVLAGESATFSTASAGIANVISRVTGGAASQINGRLALSAAAGTPALFLINPAGVVFGAGAFVDVPGAFHASTANQLRFADGVFSADPNAPSTFSAAPPEAFGFLGTTRAPLEVRDGAQLFTRPGHALSVVGGDVTIAGNGAVGRLGGAGELRIVAVGQGPAALGLTGGLPAVHGALSLTGGFVSAGNQGAADSGAVVLAAGDITMADGAALFSSTLGSGKAADVVLQAAGALTIRNGGLIDAATLGAGDAGRVQVRAGSVSIDGQSTGQTGILSSAYPNSTGRAGDVDVASAGDLTITHGVINSSGYGSGDGGAVKVTAGNIRIDGQGTFEALSGISTAALPLSGGRAGSLEVHAGGDLTLVNRGLIDSSSSSAADAGSIKVSARNISIDGGEFGYSGISSVSFTSGTGKAGNVQIRAAQDLTLVNGGQIDSSTYSGGDAGSVQVFAANVLIDGLGGNASPASIFGVSAPSSSGNGGRLEVTASGTLTILGRGSIDSSVYFDGDGGSVVVNAGAITVDARGELSGGIRSATFAPAGRKAATMEVNTTGTLSILHGGVIDSSTYGGADAGTVKVQAADILIDGKGMFSGIFSSSGTGGSGKAGNVDVVASGKLTLLGRGEIDSTTYTAGDAGSVKVVADSILIDNRGDQGLFSTGIFSEATISSSGHAGSLDVTAHQGLTILHGGMIDSSTFSSGNAGSVRVRARDIVLDGQEFAFASIASSAFPGSSGQGGSVDVAAGKDLSLRNGGRIESATYAAGAAGTVQVAAASIRVDGPVSSINASAKALSEGQTGNVVVHADDSIALSNGGRLAIQNEAQVADPGRVVPGSLEVSAPRISIAGDAKITAQATGNVAASPIDVAFTDRLVLDHGSITTSAKDGDGGAIRVQGGRLIDLRQSQITTSVLGTEGDGGNIAVRADTQLMRSGFIQANTAAANASGGNVDIAVTTLVPSGGNVFVGGELAYAFSPDVFGFNVIQAAAPTGVSGVIAISAPALDLSGSLTGLAAPLLDAGGLAKSPCLPGGQSYLSQTGRGGFAPSARGFAAPAVPAAAAARAGQPPHWNAWPGGWAWTVAVACAR